MGCDRLGVAQGFLSLGNFVEQIAGRVWMEGRLVAGGYGGNAFGFEGGGGGAGSAVGAELEEEVMGPTGGGRRREGERR